MMYCNKNWLSLSSNTRSSLSYSGFEQKVRTPVSKSSWNGLRLEGIAHKDGFEFAELVYLIQSNRSMLHMSAIWQESSADYELIENVWASLQLSFEEFPLLPALLEFEGFKTFSHAKAVFQQGFVNLAQLAGTLPPYGQSMDKLMKQQIKK